MADPTDLPKGVGVWRGKYVRTDVEGWPEVAEADALGEIVEALQAALAEVCKMTINVCECSDACVPNRVIELRDKLLGERSPRR